MDFFTLIIIGAIAASIFVAVIGIALKIIFWVFIAKKIGKAVIDYQQQYKQAASSFKDLLLQVQTDQEDTVNPMLISQIQDQYFKMQQQMRYFDQISRDRHETHVAGMLSDASAAGIDVSGWNTSNW